MTLKIFHVKGNSLKKFPFDKIEPGTVEWNNLKEFDKPKDKLSDIRYHTVPKYNIKEWFKEYKRGYTDRFALNFSRFRKFRGDMLLMLEQIINDIYKNPIPEQLFINEENRDYWRKSWKILTFYTVSFRKFLNENGIRPKQHAVVISRAIGMNSINRPFETTKPNGFRIVYEYVDGKVIFTDLDYHMYRESLYSEELIP